LTPVTKTKVKTKTRKERNASANILNWIRCQKVDDLTEQAVPPTEADVSTTIRERDPEIVEELTAVRSHNSSPTMLINEDQSTFIPIPSLTKPPKMELELDFHYLSVQQTGESILNVNKNTELRDTEIDSGNLANKKTKTNMPLPCDDLEHQEINTRLSVVDCDDTTERLEDSSTVEDESNF